MSALSTCQQCRGLIPGQKLVCVHCGASQRGSTSLRTVLAVASAGFAAVTLMACYGMPPCKDTKAGEDPYRCYNNPADAGTDGGSDAGAGDAGVTDGGATDAGADGGPP